jgi:hypothetical protein
MLCTEDITLSMVSGLKYLKLPGTEFVDAERYHEGLVIFLSVQMLCTKDITLSIVFLV